jgi:dienelactone hydrolase
MISIKSLSILALSLTLISCAQKPIESEKFTIRNYLQDKPTHTIVIAHGSGGVSTHEETWASQIKKTGLNVVILDSYTSRGIQSHTAEVLSHFTVDDRARELIKLAEWIKQQPWHKGKVGLLGFSQGGSAVLASASALRMQAMNKMPVEKLQKIDFAITYYPGCAIVNPDPTPAFPIQMHLAEQDDLAQPWRCYPHTLTDKKYELHFYKDARHGFDWQRADVKINGRHFSYNREADFLSRQRVAAFIKDQTESAQ